MERKLDDAEMISFINKYGPSARVVYSFSHCPDRYEKRITETLTATQLHAFESIVTDIWTLDVDDTSSSLDMILIKPANHRSSFCASMVSRHIAQLVIAALEAKKAHGGHRLFELIRGVTPC